MGRYKFQKYTTNSKVDCPHCGGKKTYTLYVDTEDGSLMPSEFGRCDRINSCGYLRYPNFGESKVYQANAPVEVPQVFIDKDIVMKCMVWYKKNPFTRCLSEKFGVDAEDTMKKYFIGTTKQLGTIFWTINSDMVACSAKVISYIGKDSTEKIAPYRDKDRLPYYPFKKEEGYYPCLFGQHLVDKNSDIFVVESEKTAILCDIKWPEYTWLSPGGANNLTTKKVKILRESGFNGVINIMPDADKAGREASSKWVSNFDTYGYKCIVHDLGDAYQEGEDWGDIILQDHKNENNG